MSGFTIEDIRSCLEGAVPSILATCDRQGVPNVSLISQVHYVDRDRVALSYQFFNKTRRNILDTRAASATVVDPITLAQYALDLEYEETQTEGPLFESMKAKLAGIASHTGMAAVFRLLGADVFRLKAITPVEVETLAPTAASRNLMGAVRRSCAELAKAAELDDLLDLTLCCLERNFGIRHSMVLMLDPELDRLYTVASHGYERSGIGSEVALGEGVIGVAARERVPIRISFMTSEYRYGDAIRESAARAGVAFDPATEIPFPGLAEPESQIALPILHGGRTLGVLFAESTEPMRYCYEEEDALAVVADHVGALVSLLPGDVTGVESAPPARPAIDRARTITVRRYPTDNSIFLDHGYLIKGVAGAIFWKLATEYTRHGRTEFTNRELRLDPALRLPEYVENLEARLLLLRRRLQERNSGIRLEKHGRGRFRLVLDCGLKLENMSAGSTAPPAV
ncbi:MAG TPA: GAF domain-containing protein [Alphaproteobacteria bacterium]|jgi:hypothetical protein|nr:GAF domain-containing protein [Alphaproteobacteria bacterium]